MKSATSEKLSSIALDVPMKVNSHSGYVCMLAVCPVFYKPSINRWMNRLIHTLISDDPYLHCEECFDLMHRGRKLDYHQNHPITDLDEVRTLYYAAIDHNDYQFS